MKPIILLESSIFLISILCSTVAFINTTNEIPEQHLEVVLREIGHQLLLSAKDSSSLVLPVKQIDENTYQLSFQNNFGFISDTLINIIERTFKKSALAKDYIVNLRSCSQKETVFAFEINGQTGNLTPCRGRILKVGCYFIEVHFLNTNRFNFLLLLPLIIALGLIGFYVKDKFRKKAEGVSNIDSNDFIQLGNFKFYAEHNLLNIDNNSISLTDKEAKALRIFTDNINQIVDREKLMKEIWEDNGVVVMSRNVDVLVSKLRKKLSEDSSIKLMKVHGRGYKFVIE